MRYLLLLIGLITSCCIVAQNPVVMDTTAAHYFEGSLEFNVELSGSQKEFLMENQPNNQLAMHIKDNNYIVNLAGGMYPKTFMYVADSNYEYSIDNLNQRAFRISSYSAKKPIAKRQPAVFTGKTEVVKGIKVVEGKQATVKDFECQIYEVRTDSTQVLFYVTDEYRVNYPLFKNEKRAQASFLVPGLEGRIPLKTINKQKGITSVTTAIKITARTFNKSQFLIPEGYEVKQRDVRF